ncbi:GGDEF domain-containing sensory box protein [Legionella birminghamensis]|uniref:cyclic-guanylate-specific phosphodiesterase n=1 Tax=Legionella birminghamensis TaxID=28083 RepID=A0A378I9I8_9GAMM|nr:EAL domain-containing protein [Legionella birminghamensis]KTC74693.1 GGDEF domain-containing sensory box protein [Legionella birminghamensis]STX31496.1 sensory box protein, GGDEF family protein, LssE [Legionella birminghamensis]
MNEIELRIIIIDDNPAIHQDFIKVLTMEKRSPLFDKLDRELFGESQQTEVLNLLPEFKIDTASQGAEGVAKIKQAYDEGNPYALAFVDIRMPPGWDGIETIKRMWEIDHDIQVVICSAYSDYSWEETVSNLGMTDNLLVLKKPFDKVAVRQLACALTKKWALARESRSHTESLNRIVKERTESLQQSLSLLRATIESSADGILVVNLDKKIIDFNTKFVDMWQIPESIMDLGSETLMLEYMVEQLQESEEFLRQIKDLSLEINDTSQIVVTFKTGTILECRSQPHKVNQVTVGRVWSFRDITDQALLEQKLEYQATHDPLTGLPNRILLHDRIQQAISSSLRHNRYFAIIFFDLDRFKLVNDSYSHQFGDELLCAVAKRLSSLVREEDTLARLGGDEFVMLIPELAQSDASLTVAHKILMLFTQPFEILGNEINTSASIGISIYPTDGKNANTLLKHADLAMYMAKEQGGNQLKFYINQLNHQSLKRLKQENELRRAISNQEFFLLYQPQFDMEQNHLLALEALIRWQHPEKGTVLPLDFIPVAEDSGLIVPIGEWVIREVCRQIVEWRERGLPYIRVAVNVATQQLKQLNFAETVDAILKEYQIPAEYLEIEITENVIITHSEVQRMIHQLNKIGVKIVLDDFGTGNSSLNYLKQIHIDRLKIDQSFVQNISKSRSDEVIIEAIIAMARSLNFRVLAEGVESENQMNFLKDQECDEIQGYLLSRPLRADTMEKLLKTTITTPKEEN